MTHAQVGEPCPMRCQLAGEACHRSKDSPSLVLIEPRTMTRRGLQHMINECLPHASLTAVPGPEDVPIGQLSPCVTILLSGRALSPHLSCLDGLFSATCSSLVLLADAMDTRRLHLAVGLPIDAVLREEELSETALAEVLGRLDAGSVSVSRDTMRHLLALAAESAGHPAAGPASRLSARELTVLQLMTPGRSNRQIANCMGITEHGVKRHVANILVKLGCQNRTMAVACALRLGLVDLESVDA